MYSIVFKNLESSDLVKNVVKNFIEEIHEKFPNVSKSKINIVLSMNNSATQAGKDDFEVSLHIQKGEFDGLILKKSAMNLYTAIADLKESVLERFNRNLDKKRVKARTSLRKLKRAN